jgi:subtilisin family serine protease
MRVPVLITLPAQEPLRESAAAAMQNRAPDIPLEAANIPPRVELDRSFPAVPIGVSERVVAMEAMQPHSSPDFAIRGFIDVDTLEDIPEEINGRPVHADALIAPFVTCGSTPPVGNAADVKTKLDVATLHAKGLDGDGVAIAVMDTGINATHLKTKLGALPRMDVANSWTPPGSTTAPFKYPVDHGTMSAYDVLLAAPKATLLDFPILAGSIPGGSTVGSSIGEALLGFSQLLTFWAVAFAVGGANRYSALVVSNSWGIYHPSWDFPAGHRGRYCDNPRHPFNIVVSALAQSADIIFAAGNCGADCASSKCQGRVTETIMGANAHPEVLTLAGCDTNDARVGYPSQGPSITGMFQQKPDLTAYTHFLGSEAFGAGSADSGTSTACPIAAGCVAAIRTKESAARTTPVNLFAQLRATARSVSTVAGWNGDYGHGIIDAVAAAQSLGL